MKSVFLVLITLFVAHVCLGQSKPLDLSVTLSDLNNYQALADKGQANGYTPLNSNSLVPPNFLFPGFSLSQDGTIWSKSGNSWLAISNLTVQPFSLVVSLTKVGKLSPPGVSLNIYGVGTELSTIPLVLYGGNSRVYVASGQSIGGANVNFNDFTWSINSSGNFDLNSGIIKGGMSLNNTSISNISSIFSSSGLSINFTNNRITSLQSGKDVIFAGDDFGVQVPNIQTNKLLNPSTSETTRNYALNVRSADLLYVAKNSSNNWTLPQRFTGGISISPALSISNGGTGATNAQQARQNLGITTGVTGGFQAWSTVLTSLASNVPTTNNFLVGISSAWVSRTPAQVRSILGVEIGSGGLQPYSATLNYISTIVTNNSLGSKYIFVGDPVTQTLTARTAAFARSDLGLEINSTNGVQAYSPYLRDIANLGIPQLDEFLVGTGTAWTKKTPSQARISLGLGATWLTNNNTANFRTDIGLGATWLTNTNVTNFRTDISLGWSALTNSNTATSLLGFTSNGQVVANTTNTLTITNLVKIQVPNNTNVDVLTVIGGGDNSGSGNQSLVIRNATVSGTNDLVSAGFELGVAGLTFSGDLAKTTTRANLGLGATWLTNTNATNFRTDIGLGSSDVASFGGVRLDMSNTITWGTGNSTIYSVLNTQPQINFATLGVIRATLGDGRLTLANGTVLQFDGMPNGPTAAATTRTNLGLGATWLTNTSATNFRTDIGLGLSVLTNTNVTNFRTDIGLGQTNSVTFSEVTATNTFYPPTFSPTNLSLGAGSLRMTGSSTTTRLVYKLLGASPADRTVLAAEDNLSGLSSAATSRTNLGIGGGFTGTKTFITTNNVTNTVVISNGIITSWTP